MNLPAAPPVNVAAEQSVLGTLIVFYKPELVHVVQSVGVKWSDFYYRQHRVVYRAVLRLHADGSHVDDLTVRRLLDSHRCSDVDTPALMDMLAASARPAAFREHARIVAEDGRWRRWLTATLEALECIHARDEDSFWAAVGRVREDVLPGETLRLVEGEAA